MHVGVQEGSPTHCARQGCKSYVTYRVILGSWNVQVYCCTRDLKWALDLDHTLESDGKALGWFYGYPTKWVTDWRGNRVPVSVEIRQPLVDASVRYGSRRLPDVPRDATSQLIKECPEHGPDTRYVEHCGACMRMGRSIPACERTDEMRYVA